MQPGSSIPLSKLNAKELERVRQMADTANALQQRNASPADLKRITDSPFGDSFLRGQLQVFNPQPISREMAQQLVQNPSILGQRPGLDYSA